MSEKLTKEDAATMEGHNQPISDDEIRDYVKELEKNAADSAKLDGDRAAIYSRAEKAGIHKKALKSAISVKKMDEHSRIYYMESFDRYSDVLGLREADQGTMDLEDVKTDGNK